MRAKWGLIDMRWLPYGKIIDGGLKSLKSIINELKKNLLKKKKYIIEMKKINLILLMHLKSGTKKQKQKSSCVDTIASISKRNLDIIHGNQNLRRIRSKKKQQQNPLLYKKNSSSIHYYNKYKFRKSGAVQQ